MVQNLRFWLAQLSVDRITFRLQLLLFEAIIDAEICLAGVRSPANSSKPHHASFGLCGLLRSSGAEQSNRGQKKGVKSDNASLE